MYNVNACEHFSYSSILIDVIYNLSTNLLTSAIWQPVAIILTRVTMTISQVVVVGTPPERKQKLSFSSCSLIACALVFFSYLFFFFFSCTRITEQKGKCFGSIFFGNKRINIFSQKLNRNCVSFALWSSRLSCRTFLREFIWRKIVLRAMIMSGWSPLQWKQHKHKPVCKSGLGSFCCYHSAVQHLSRTSIEDDSHHKIDLNYCIDSHLLCLQYDLRKKKIESNQVDLIRD